LAFDYVEYLLPDSCSDLPRRLEVARLFFLTAAIAVHHAPWLLSRSHAVVLGALVNHSSQRICIYA